MGVAYWTEQMASDANDEMAERKAQLLADHLDNFANGYNVTKTRRQTTWI